MVRPFEPKDAEQWSAKRQQLWPDPGRIDLDELASLHVPNTVFVAEVDNRLVGFAEVSIRSVVEEVYFEPAAYLEGIWVDDNHRRHGVADQLLSAVMDWAKAQGVSAIGSDASPENTASLAWHARAGFEEVDRPVLLLKRFDDARN